MSNSFSDITKCFPMNYGRDPGFNSLVPQLLTTTSAPANDGKPRPVNILEEVSHHVPNRAWTVIAKNRLKHRNRFPNWCHFPYSEFAMLLVKKCPMDLKPINLLHVLSAWRATQGIYQMDRDLLKELTRSPLDGDVPVEVLVHQPEWCVYVQLPDPVRLGGFRIAGFFAMMTLTDAESKNPMLTVVWDYSNREDLDMDSIELKGTIQDSIDAFMEQTPAVFRRGMGTIPFSLNEQDRRDLYQRFNLVIPILLYLASVGKYRDIRSSNGGNAVPANPQGSNMKPPKAPKQWEVGWRIGPVLARALDEAERSQTVVRGTHASPRPHIRRGHYRRCRVGPGRFGVRTVWIPPVHVNFRYGNTVPVLRPVTKKAS
jgi:hypothetical protein